MCIFLLHACIIQLQSVHAHILLLDSSSASVWLIHGTGCPLLLPTSLTDHAIISVPVAEILLTF